MCANPVDIGLWLNSINKRLPRKSDSTGEPGEARRAGVVVGLQGRCATALMVGGAEKHRGESDTCVPTLLMLDSG